jgi:hypothetical protein
MRQSPHRIRGLALIRGVYLVCAIGYLLHSRVALALLPTQKLLGRLGRRRGKTRVHADGVVRFDPELATWAICAAARRVPWRSDCLIQALAAAAWLRRHGHEPVARLGVARGQGTLQAHAWLVLEERVIVGGENGAADAYVPIAFDASADAQPSR